MSPTCRLEHWYTKPTLTYGMLPRTVGTTMYIWDMSMQFEPRISNPYSPLPSGTGRSQNNIKGGIHSTREAGSEDYPRCCDYPDQEQSQQHRSNNHKCPHSQLWQLWGYQKWQVWFMKNKLQYPSVELVLCDLVDLGGDCMAWILCNWAGGNWTQSNTSPGSPAPGLHFHNRFWDLH